MGTEHAETVFCLMRVVPGREDELLKRCREHDETLARCYRRSLEEAVCLGAATVAFPNISTGVYGFPKERAAPIAVAPGFTKESRNSGPPGQSTCTSPPRPALALAMSSSKRMRPAGSCFSAGAIA